MGKTYSEIEKQIQKETNPYKLKSLKTQLSWMDAQINGQFVTIDDLKAHKGYIIDLAKKYSFFKTQEEIKETMNRLMNSKIVFRTKRGIKGQIAKFTKDLARTSSWNELVRREGENVDMSTQSNPVMFQFEQFYLNLK